MFKRAFLFILIASLNGFVCSQDSLLRKTQFDSIVNEFGRGIQRYIQADTLGESISIAIVHKNKIVWSKAFGYLDVEKKTLTDTLTIYLIGSISKSFTAFLLMRLVEKGLLKLQDPV
jgi:CubicO group peptidase (beta-lactamase class C family)